MSARLRVITVGRPRQGPFAELDADYSERLARLAPFRREHVSQSRKKRAEERRRDEGRAVLAMLDAQERVVALDAGGRTFDSPRFAERLEGWRAGARGVGFVVGGPDGHSSELRARADFELALGTMTLPHDLALVVLLEQLYRALLHLAGHPYARH